MDKSKQIWFRFNNDQKALKNECVDIVGKLYLMLGHNPESQQIVLMAQFLYNDLINKFGTLEMPEVSFALEEGLKNGKDGFINVRNFNKWIIDYKKNAQLKRQQNLITDFQLHNNKQKEINNTIQKAKQLNGGDAKSCAP